MKRRAARFNDGRPTPTTRIARIAFANSPPTPEELTTKGTLNSARATANRREEIETMFAAPELAIATGVR